MSTECRVHRSKEQNQREAFRKLVPKIVEWIDKFDKSITDKSINTTIIRTYHVVENRVKDHESGFTQLYTDVDKDISDMIHARRKVINGQLDSSKSFNTRNII